MFHSAPQPDENKQNKTETKLKHFHHKWEESTAPIGGREYTKFRRRQINSMNIHKRGDGLCRLVVR